MRRSPRIVLAAAVAAFLSLGVCTAGAHVVKRSGSFKVKMGWGDEPPVLAGHNFVEVEVSDAATGAPVAVPAGALSVEVSYGGRSVSLPLGPSDTPGLLQAPITPTRLGTYGFSVTGDVYGKPLDITATCSESTFECVEAGAGNEFPVKDPTAGELAQRVSSEAQRVEQASSRADGARTLAVIGLAIGAIGLATGVVALAAAVRVGRRRESG